MFESSTREHNLITKSPTENHQKSVFESDNTNYSVVRLVAIAQLALSPQYKTSESAEERRRSKDNNNNSK
jgi:hypothetical protein